MLNACSQLTMTKQQTMPMMKKECTVRTNEGIESREEEGIIIINQS
jgi:hypothetical protein